MVGNYSDDKRRQRRVGGNIKEQLSMLLVKGARDPSLTWATITDVDLSPDLKNARVYFSAMGADKDVVGKALKKATPFLQREVGRNLKLRYIPKLNFLYDESFEKGSRIDDILLETRKESFEKKKNETLEDQLARLVSESKRILVCTHVNPDGDALGSLLALGRILTMQGKKPVVYCPDEIGDSFNYILDSVSLDRELSSESSFDMTILLDTGGTNLFPRGFPTEENRGTFVVIDHHMNHEEFGDIVIRKELSSVGELLFGLAKELVWPMDGLVAQCLYTSIVSDTGSFRYTNTTPNTHEVAAQLLELGASPWNTAIALYESFSLSRQKLLGLVAGTLEVSEDGKFADLFCSDEMLAQTGSSNGDLDGMINLGRGILGVEVTAMYKESPNNSIKVSFRSRGEVDVASLATLFGGGGHRAAAGATLSQSSLEQAKLQIREAASRLISQLE